MQTRISQLACAALVLALAAACSDGGATVSLAFSTRELNSVQQGDSTVVIRGSDTVIIRRVELVLREIELELLNDDCPDSSGVDDDACEEFSTSIQLVDLPLGNATDKTITIEIPAGVYDELEFEIHKPDDSTDAAFIAAHPDFADVSIRVSGTFSQGGTRSDFVYITDLNEEQEIELDPPLDVTTDGAINVTLRLDVGTWFLAAGGSALVDPASANNGGPNENLVENNIRASIDAFHDDDSDGLDDDHEDDDGGSSHDSP